MLPVYESKHEPLAKRRIFISRLARMGIIAFSATLVCLLIGIAGYHYIARLAWIDSLHNASMILSGMGPVATINNDSGKLFSSFYALFSGVAFITNVGIFLSPAIHRFLHKIHLEKHAKQD